jgi:hypothetical protein
MSETSPKKYARGLSSEEKEERRKMQLREAQLRFRETHGMVKPKLSEEERRQLRKQKAHERYLKRKETTTQRPAELPQSYTVEYQRNYHKTYYENHKEKLLGRAKSRYSALKVTPETPTEPSKHLVNNS